MYTFLKPFFNRQSKFFESSRIRVIQNQIPLMRLVILPEVDTAITILLRGQATRVSLKSIDTFKLLQANLGCKRPSKKAPCDQEKI